MPKFNHYDLALLNPSFDSPLVDALTELELLRHLRLETDVHPLLFAQLKVFFICWKAWVQQESKVTIQR